MLKVETTSPIEQHYPTILILHSYFVPSQLYLVMELLLIAAVMVTGIVIAFLPKPAKEDGARCRGLSAVVAYHTALGSSLLSTA